MDTFDLTDEIRVDHDGTDLLLEKYCDAEGVCTMRINLEDIARLTRYHARIVAEKYNLGTLTEVQGKVNIDAKPTTRLVTD